MLFVFTCFFDKLAKIKYPIKPEVKDPIKIPILAESRNSGLLAEAKLAIKIEIVKTTPAISETPIMCRILISFGTEIQLIFLSKIVKR